MNQRPSDPNQPPLNQYPPQQGYPRYSQGQYPLQQPYQQPIPTPPKKTLWQRFLASRKRTKIGLGCATFFALLFVCSAITGISQAASGQTHTATANISTPPTDTPAPTDTPTPQPSNAFKLATIDANGNTPDTTTVTKYQTLLDSLHKKTGESEQTISNETVNGQTLVKSKYGKDVSLLELLQRADESDPGGDVKIHYNEVLAAYITLAYGQ